MTQDNKQQTQEEPKPLHTQSEAAALSVVRILDNGSDLTILAKSKAHDDLKEFVNGYQSLLDENERLKRSLKQVYDLAEDMGMIMTSDQWNEKFRNKFNPIMTAAEFLITTKQ